MKEVFLLVTYFFPPVILYVELANFFGGNYYLGGHTQVLSGNLNKFQLTSDVTKNISK